MRKILLALPWLGPKARVALVVTVVLGAVGGVSWLIFRDKIESKVDEWRASNDLKEAKEFAEN